MAEIRVLPVRSHRLDQSDRVHADLAAAYAGGEPLGSRAPHIQGCGERLLASSRLFEDAVDRLDQSLADLGLQDQASSEAMPRFASAVKGVAGAAQRFRPDL